MSRPEQWCLNVCLVLFMSIAVFIAIVWVTLTVTKSFIVESFVHIRSRYRNPRQAEATQSFLSRRSS